MYINSIFCYIFKSKSDQNIRQSTPNCVISYKFPKRAFLEPP